LDGLLSVIPLALHLRSLLFGEDYALLQILIDQVECIRFLTVSLLLQFLLPAYQSFEPLVLKVSHGYLPLQLPELVLHVRKLGAHAMLLVVDLGEALLISCVLSGYLSYGLLLLRPPEDHGILDLERSLVGVLRGLQALVDRVGVHLVLRVQLGDVRLQLAVHVCLEAVHVKLDELPRGLL
jgi:hypothetical protein